MRTTNSAAGDPTLLIVDDEWLIIASIADYFRDLGFAILQARSADGAIQILQRTRVDVVVSDISMPGKLNGLDLAKWLQEERPAVALILMSGAPQKFDVVERLGSPVAFFAKPFGLPALESCIREQLGMAG